jgi:hypothetical protein
MADESHLWDSMAGRMGLKDSLGLYRFTELQQESHARQKLLKLLKRQGKVLERPSLDETREDPTKVVISSLSHVPSWHGWVLFFVSGVLLVTWDNTTTTTKMLGNIKQISGLQVLNQEAQQDADDGRIPAAGKSNVSHGESNMVSSTPLSLSLG